MAISNLILNVSIVLFILAAMVELVVDVRDVETPEFLPPALAAYPSSQPATALVAVGLALAALSAVLMLVSGPFNTGQFVVALIALLAFLFAGGFVLDDEEGEPA